MYVDPDGETEYITTVTQNEKTGETIIEMKKANRVMTDGVRHIRGGDASWHYENDYYDYATITLRTIKSDGSVTESSRSHIMYDRYKDSEAVWSSGDLPGDTKTEDHFSWVPEISDFGGIVIYGSASSNKDSSGTEATGEVWGSFDLAAFNEIMGLITTGITSKSENTLEPDNLGTKVTDLVNKVKEVVEHKNDHRNRYCVDCTRTFDQEGNVVSDDESPKDTITYREHD